MEDIKQLTIKEVAESNLFLQLFEYVDNQAKFYKAITDKGDYSNETVVYLSNMATAFRDVRHFMETSIATILKPNS